MQEDHRNNVRPATPIECLEQYWGYTRFRPLQEDIIESVLQGKDTLALLPTGGGKSICYQVPSLMMDGICLVISPLIALIEDQVQALRSRGIQAEAVNSMLGYRDIDRILDNCIYGGVKFLFISPERISNELFRARVIKMNVSLIAVDEAHCISQWGHDFRPAYRQIAELRSILERVPLLALTASATPEVCTDIKENLEFGKGSHIQGNFSRENLKLSTISTEDKRGQLLQLADRLKEGSGIVYVRNRRRCSELANLLQSQGHSATLYHAGLDRDKRSEASSRWLSGDCAWVVATNAFGMGIDKGDVRMVIHYDVSDSLESYYQEAGRAGRDGAPSEAIHLFHETDLQGSIRKLQDQYPELDYIKRLYASMSDQLSLAAGSGQGEVFGLDISTLSDSTEAKIHTVLGGLKALELSGLIQMHLGIRESSKVQIMANSNSLLGLESKEDLLSRMLFYLLRSHNGIAQALSTVREEQIARHFSIDPSLVTRTLMQAESRGLLSYKPRKGDSSVTYLLPRQHPDHIRLEVKAIRNARSRHLNRLYAMIGYLRNPLDCRMLQLVDYFGGEAEKPCGICEVCETDKSDLQLEHLDSLRRLRARLNPGAQASNSSLESLRNDYSSALLRWAVDQGFLKYEENQVTWIGPETSKSIKYSYPSEDK